jgi:hypothetical protein
MYGLDLWAINLIHHSWSPLEYDRRVWPPGIPPIEPALWGHANSALVGSFKNTCLAKVKASIVACYPLWPTLISSLTNSLCTQNCHYFYCWSNLVLYMAECKWLDSCSFKVCFLSIKTMTLEANIGDLQQVTLEINNIFFLCSKILIQSLAYLKSIC